jgi:hypothetical protein
LEYDEKLCQLRAVIYGAFCDHKKYFDEGMSSKQLIDGCLEYLNYIPEPARKTKKIQKPKYGKIQPLSLK